MDLTPGTPGPISASPKRWLRPALRIVLVLGILLLAVIFLLALVLSSDQKVVWLTPTELTRPAHSTVFARYKYRLAVLVWPLIHNYWHGHPSISVTTSLLTLSSTAIEQTGLGAPFATNASGLRIWILSPTELASFRKRLSLNSSGFVKSVMGGPRVETADGMQSQASTSGPTNSLAVDIIPKIVSSSIKLTIGVTATELLASQTGIPGITRTNLSVACRVLVPNAGGLVMESGTTKDSSGNTCLMIASPTAVDSRGNPIKL